MTTFLMKHLASAVSKDPAVSSPVVFHLDGQDIAVGASWYRREKSEEIGEHDHNILQQSLRVPKHLLPRMPRFRDEVTVDGERRRVEDVRERGPVYLVFVKD